MDLKRAAEGLTVIAVGSVLLANTLGYLPWSVWWNVLSLWPLLIIAAGIDIIGRGTDNTWLRVLASLLVVGGLLYGAFLMTPSGRWFPFVTWGTSMDSTPFDERESHDADVKSGIAEIGGGVGEFTLGAGSDLVSAAGETPFDGPAFSTAVIGDEAEVQVSLGKGTTVWPSGTTARLDVLLDRSVVWDLRIDAGVSRTEADLSDLRLSALTVDAGVSDTSVMLGEISSTADPKTVPVHVDGGVSSIELRIPRGTQARVLVKGGLSAINVDPGIRRLSGGSDKHYETDGFYDGAAYYDIVIDAGVGSISIDLY
ncbi:MAG: DUF5668 domain-containing protein [Coriobacteriia bacterium]|nr:DUF5668 domain-containing protein [Coriobacteriia bacterium]